MPVRAASQTAVDPIATAPAFGGAIVTAVHVPADHAIYVACSRHGLRITNTYGPQASRDESRAGHTAAAICAQAHARHCTADRVKRHLAVTGSAAPR